MDVLLTREEFRRRVLARFDGRCSVPGCPNPAEDAHHIIERRLWEDGGYYEANGAPLCDQDGRGCHMRAEKNEILPRQLREWNNIERTILPPQLDDYLEYDKWGEVVGESTKHPRTFHLPWSPGATDDDKTMVDVNQLVGPVVVTEKMDGENTTMTRDRIHARSVDSESHSSQSWARNLWSRIRYDIPEGMRVTGENMYATHSIHYTNLPGYFLVHGVWMGSTMLAWEEIAEWAELLELPLVPVLNQTYIVDERSLQVESLRWEQWQSEQSERREGFIIRTAAEINIEDFRSKVGKWVRPNHVRTLDHGWRYRNDYQINLTENLPRGECEPTPHQ